MQSIGPALRLRFRGRDVILPLLVDSETVQLELPESSRIDGAFPCNGRKIDE